MRAMIIAAAMTLAACGDAAPEATPQNATTAEPAAATEDQAGDAETAAAAPVEVAAAADQSPAEEFYSACVVGFWPSTKALVKLTEAPLAGFLNTVAGDAEVTWEAFGDKGFIARAERVNQLTQETSPAAIQLRQVNAAPISSGFCGPRAVVVETMAIDGQQLDAKATYETVSKIASSLHRELEASDEPRPYVEPVSTENDAPYTETIQTWREAYQGSLPFNRR